jgi:hypothetical protein
VQGPQGQSETRLNLQRECPTSQKSLYDSDRLAYSLQCNLRASALHEVSKKRLERCVTSDESAHDGGPFEEPHQIAAHIAQGLRASGITCETLIFVPAEAAVIRRDRIVIVLALTCDRVGVELLALALG